MPCGLIWHVPEYEEADYVEGVIVDHRQVVTEHGWVEFRGVIVDPTLPDDDLLYYPGLRFTGRHGISEAMRIPKASDLDDLPILDRFGEGGSDSPDWAKRLSHFCGRNFVFVQVSPRHTTPPQ